LDTEGTQFIIRNSGQYDKIAVFHFMTGKKRNMTMSRHTPSIQPGAPLYRDNEESPERGAAEVSLHFERLISDLSARFANVSVDEVDREIEDAQRLVCEHLDIDASSLWQLSADTPGMLILTHLYRPLGGPPTPAQMDARQHFPWCLQQVSAGRVIAVSNTEEVPEEATRDREVWRHFGIKTTLTVPLSAGGGPLIGALSFNDMKKERHWPDTLVKRLQLVAQIFAGALDRRRTYLLLEQRLRFETLISGLSARFVNVFSEEVDGEIENALQQVLGYFQVDRCGLLGFSSDRKSLHVTHGVYDEGIARISSDVDLVRLFPWAYERLVTQGEYVSVSRMSELSPEAERDRQSWAAMGVQSSLIIPLFFGGSVSALIVIGSLRRQRFWPEEYIPRLRLLGEIFLNALERKRVDESLRESEARLQLATDSAGAGLWGMDVGTRRVWVTPKTRALFCFPPDEEITYESFDTRIHPEDRGPVRRAVQEALRTGAELSVEFRAVLPGGGLRWIGARGRLHRAPSGGTQRLMGVSVDVTERKQMQDQILTAVDEWYRTFNTIQDMIVIMDREFRIIQANDATVKFFGLPKKRIIGTPCFKLMHGTESPIDGCPYKKVLDTKRHEETEVYDEKRGKWFHVAVDPVFGAGDDVSGVVHTVKDITEQKIAEIARRETMERYRAVVEAYDGHIYICSRDFRIEFMNQRLIERTGRDAAGELCYRVLHDRDSVCPWCVNERVFQGETVRWEIQSPKDQRWYYVVNAPIRHADGAISKQSMIMDITERKKAEMALEESRTQIAAVMNSTKDFIWSVDPKRFGLLSWNRAFGDYFFEQRGIDLHVGMTPTELVPPEYVPLWHDLFSRALREEFIVVEYVVVAQTMTLLLSLHVMKQGDQVFGISVFGKDITALKKAEETLKENEAALRSSQQDLRKLAGKLISAKEEELKRLSRELHDDLTQRLAVLAIEAGKIEIQLSKMPQALPEPVQKISGIKEQLIRVSEDVHRISRQLHPTILDDLGLVRAIESECAAVMSREKIEIIFQKEDVPDEIDNDIALCLYRVVQESLRNVLTHSRAESCKILLKGADTTLCLTVSDDGVGFDPAEVRHKPGLGLSSMRERAQLVKGVFTIRSRIGHGSVIRACVPLDGGSA
jgi:PAS domain S-box-containing protein